MNDIPLWIVVPVFNRPDATYHFIAQCLSQTYQAFRLVVVDHGTSPIDGGSAFDDARLTVLGESSDLWWTGAVNAGIRYVLEQSTSTDDLVLVINDDVHIDEDYLDSLVQAALRSPATILGSVCVRSHTDQIIFAGVSLQRARARFRPSLRASHTVSALPEYLIPTDVLPGRGMLVPLKVFKEIGLFDEERLPHYCADHEFSWRARQRGFRLAVSPQCIVGTERKAPPIVTASTTLREFLYSQSKCGNLPAAAGFANLCFSRPYALYYTGAQLMRYCLSYAKRWLIYRCRRFSSLAQ